MNKELNICICGNKPITICTNSDQPHIRGKAIHVVRCEKCTMQSKEYLCDVNSLDKAIKSWNDGNTHRPDIYSGGRWWKWEEYQEFYKNE